MTGTVYSGLNLEAVAERVRLIEDQAVDASDIALPVICGIAAAMPPTLASSTMRALNKVPMILS